jgi:thioredoxin 1
MRKEIKNMGKHTFDVSDSSFQTEVLNSDTPVLVDFWADWCQPCKMVAPHLEAIAEKYMGRLRVAKLDVDANPDTQEHYGIQGIPTMLLFKNGALVHKIVGFKPKDYLEMEIVPHLPAVKLADEK